MPFKGGKAQPSWALMQKKAQREAMESGKIFDEIGILPDTFVTQRMAERPEWVKAPGDRWLWEKARLKARIIATYQFVVIKYWMVRTRHPDEVRAMGFLERIRYSLAEWHKFELFKSTKIADQLYKDMYKALADGNVEPLHKCAKREIFQSLKSRIAARGATTDTTWSLDKYHHRPRLVSYTAALIDPNRPKWAQNWLQQAVVELDTDQSLTRRRTVAGAAAKDGQQKVAQKISSGRVREYFVIQKAVVDGVPGPWQIWGMTQPTSIVDVRRVEAKKMGLSDDVE